MKFSKGTICRWGTLVLISGAMLSVGGAGCAAELAPGGETPAPPSNAVPQSGVRRLTRHEFDLTVQQLLGDDTRPSGTRLPGDSQSPFDNDANTQVISAALIEGAEELAADVSSRFLSNTAKRDEVIGCVATGPDDAECLRRFVTAFGRRALRQPLAEDEIARYVEAASKTAVAESDFYAGIDVVLRALLQDVRFLYRIETGTPVPNQPGVFRLSNWEVASRLAFLLWGSAPDDALLDRAAAGELSTPEQVRAAAAEMLKTPRAVATVERFHAMWLGYEGIQLEAKLAASMRDETNALIRRVIFDENLPWQDLLRFDETFVPDSLAAHYGLPTHGSEQPAWTKYGTSGRGGLLSQGAFLSNGAKFLDTSPTMRGVAVRERMLCQPIPPPPPESNTDDPPPSDGKSDCKIDRYKAIAADAGCANCHARMDKIGFGLENYDSEGKFRAKETDPALNCPIDGTGEVVDIGSFRGPAELGKLLASSKELTSCAVTQLYRFVHGRSALGAADQTIVDDLANPIAANDFRFGDLVVDLVSVPSFLFRAGE